MDPKRFFTSYWGKKPLYISRSQSGINFSKIYSFRELSKDLKTGRYETRFLKLLDGRSRECSNGSALGIARKLKQDGALSLLVRSVQQFQPSVGNVARKIEQDLGASVNGNLYWSGPKGQAFPVHWDTHDVFVLQLEGQKRWSVYAPALRNPVAGYQESKDYSLQTGEAILKLEMTPGDLLYFPSGFPHQASAGEQGSLHLTLGVSMPHWLDWLHDLLEKSLADVAGGSLFRATYPGFMSKSSRHLVSRMKEQVFAQFVRNTKRKLD
jgi:ribosomal protein L16 Arg81 hydroxylase